MSDVTKIKLPDNSEYNIKDYRIPGVDSTPTSGSNNVVTSGGVYNAIQTDSVWEAGTGTTSIIIKNSSGTAGGNNSTVEGKGCVTGGTHSSYDLTPDTADTTAGSYAHAEGRYTIACGKQGCHAEGDRTLATSQASHAEGVSTIASGNYAHAEGGLTSATGGGAHAEGRGTTASGNYSHAEGQGSVSSGSKSHAGGYYSIAIGSESCAEGDRSISRGQGSHSESLACAYGWKSHAETGNKGIDVFPVGAANATSYTSTWDTEFDPIRNAIGDTALCNIIKGSAILTKSATAMNPIVITDASLSNNTLSITLEKTLSDTALDGSVNYWIIFSVAYGDFSHTENSGNVSYGEDSHAEGGYNIAQGKASHVEGWFTFTNNASEHAEGSYNLSTKTSTTYGNAGNTQHSIGIGTSSARKNAVEVMQNGDTYLYGVGSYNGTNYSSASTLQTVINGKYEKPSGGIPAADIASGVIPSTSGLVSKSGDTMDGDATLEFVDVTGDWITNIGPNLVSVHNDDDQFGVHLYDGRVVINEGSIDTSTYTQYPYTAYSGSDVEIKTNSNTYLQSFPFKSGTFAMTSDIISSSTGALAEELGGVGLIVDTGGEYYAIGPNNANGTEDYILATTDQLPSSGSLLPSVTSSDNGKVLTVVSGTWTATTASGGNVSDVTVGGTSVVSNGVAVIPAIPTVPTISTDVASDKANNNKVTGAKAVYDEIHPAVENSQPVGGFEPNILYDLGTLTGTVTFTMASPTDATIINHYYWTFETSSTAPTITWPAGITSWFGGNAPTISASKHYEISVLDGVGCFMEV